MAAVAALLCLYVVWRQRRSRTKRLIGELLKGYKAGWQNVGPRAREITNARFLGGPKFCALTHAAFQQAADAKLAHCYSREVEQRLLDLFAALRASSGCLSAI
jgi:hypothetical protein